MSRYPSLSLFLLCALSASAGWAQSTFGTIVGSVHDPSGAVIANCVVHVVNSGTSAKRSTVTDATGSYTVVNLEPGTYEVSMEMPGFHRAAFPSLNLLARQTIRVDGRLTLSSQTETVNVTVASEAVITTEVSNISETKTNRELMDLPVAIGSRGAGSTSPISTLTTQAGVQVDNSGNLSVAGAKPAMLSVSVDGISSMSPRNSAPLAELFPSFGAIAEIRVSEINNAAEFGGVSDITTISRGGSNSYHGGAFENLQNTALNARNPFASSKPKLNMNNFGFFLGGPLSIPGLYDGRNKTFFFITYEGLKLPRESSLVQSVPSLALRSGDLSVYKTTILDPYSSGTPFPNAQIPASRISPVSAKALQYLFPLPNYGDPSSIANNFRTNFATPITSNQGDLRLDRNISSSQTAFARFTYKKRETNDAPGGTVLAGATRRPEYNYGLTVAHNFILSANIVNELRGGVNGNRTLAANDTNASAMISALGLVGLPSPPPGNGGPNFSITGFQSTSAAASSFSKAETIQILDNLTWTRGKHTYKFGGDFRHLSGYFSNVFATSRAGTFTFNNSSSGTGKIIGNPFAAFLLGVPDRTTAATVKAADTYSKANHWAFYAQDDWKITSRLTINYGLRWEYHPAFRDSLNNIANFLLDGSTAANGSTVRGTVVMPDAGMNLINPDFAAAISPTPFISASQAGLPQSLHYSKKTSFAPRVGLAWRPFADGKTVIRAGYGKYIETLLSSLITAGWAVGASNVGQYNQSVVNGLPSLTFPSPFPANLSQPGTATFEYASDIHYTDPYVQQWNLTVERDLGHSLGLRLTYDGSHGTNLGVSTNANQVPANTIGYTAASANAPFPLFNHITRYINGGRSNYNAFTTALNKRTSHGLQFNASYVFAKNLSNGNGYNPTGFSGEAGGMVTDRFNLDLDYGRVAFTRRHRFLTTFVYDLPFGKGRTYLGHNKALDYVVGNWQLGGVVVLQTGPYLTVVSPSADPAGNGFPTLEGSGRSDILSGVPLYPANQGPAMWINSAAFERPKDNIGRAGNSPIGSVVGPGTQAVSLSLFKSFAITEGVRFQIGAAASNAFNHQNLGTPNLSLGTAAFGTITSLQSQEGFGARSVQLTGRISF